MLEPDADSKLGEGEVDLSQQTCHDAEPFRIEWLSAKNGLACPTIRVSCITLVALLAVEVCVHPRSVLSFVLLSGFVGSRPIASSPASCGRSCRTPDSRFLLPYFRSFPIQRLPAHGLEFPRSLSPRSILRAHLRFRNSEVYIVLRHSYRCRPNERRTHSQDSSRA
jgi:hypothetical protein